MKNLLKPFLIILISAIMHTSCENEIEFTEVDDSSQTGINEIEVDEDPNFIFVEDSKGESANKAATVQLSNVVVFLSRKSTASGSLKLKVVRSRDNKVIATSASLNVSALTKNTLGNVCNKLPFNRVSFNLNSNSAKVTVGEKYRIEVHCSKKADDGGSNKNAVYWAYQKVDVYPNGCSTYTSIPLKHCGLDFTFESWNFKSNGTRELDQIQQTKRCARTVNDSGSKISGQEFIVRQ